MSYFFPSVIGLPTEGMSGPTGWLSPVTSGGTADTVSVDAWHTALGTGTPETARRPSTRKVLVVHSAINRRTCEPADMEWCGYTFASGANHQFDRRQLEIPDCTHGPAGACTTVCEFRVAGQCRRECAPVTVGAPTCPKHVRSRPARTRAFAECNLYLALFGTQNPACFGVDMCQPADCWSAIVATRAMVVTWSHPSRWAP